jgi:hypothetical protein
MPVSHRQSSHNSESVRPVKDAFFPDALSLASEGRGPCRGVWRTPGWHNVSLENLTFRPTNWACLNAATTCENVIQVDGCDRRSGLLYAFTFQGKEWLMSNVQVYRRPHVI